MFDNVHAEPFCKVRQRHHVLCALQERKSVVCLAARRKKITRTPNDAGLGLHQVHFGGEALTGQVVCVKSRFAVCAHANQGQGLP